MSKLTFRCLAAAVLICGFEFVARSQTRTNSPSRTDAATAAAVPPRPAAVTAAGPASAVGTAAEVNGRVITVKEVDDSLGVQLYKLEMQIYTLRTKALNNLITKTLLEDEARARGITVEALRKQLVPEKAAISPGEVDQAYTINPDQFPNLTEDEAKQKLSVDLESKRKFEIYQAALTDLKSKAKVNILLQPPSAPEVALSDNGPKLGKKDATVTIVEFSDFQCPFCKQAANVIRQVVEANGDDVRLVFKHLPLPMHAQAFRAAQAAYCAGEQSKFWEYHDVLFERSDDLSEPALLKYAAELELKPKEFGACLNSEASRAEIIRDMQEARQSGVSGTPSFFINGRMYRGVRSMDDFQATIKQELDKKRKTASSR